MAKNRYEHFTTIWNEEFSHTQKGFLNETFKENLKALPYFWYEIPLQYKYRPDLITLNFYGNYKLYWVLVYVNHFKNSPFDFDFGVRIKIPNFADLLSLL